MNTPSTHKVQRAIISVSDKSGIAEFAQKLNNLGTPNLKPVKFYL